MTDSNKFTIILTPEAAAVLFGVYGLGLAALMKRPVEEVMEVDSQVKELTKLYPKDALVANGVMKELGMQLRDQVGERIVGLQDLVGKKPS